MLRVGLLGGIPGLIMRAHAAVAQLVEQRIRNAKVASSTPASGTIQEHLQTGLRPESQVLFAFCRNWIGHEKAAVVGAGGFTPLRSCRG